MADDSVVRLPIENESGECIGWLESISRRDLEDFRLITNLTDWRNANRRFFLTQFEATPERTLRWLEQEVISDKSRILFLIKTDAGVPIGHLGVLGIGTDSPELDNMIRGQTGGDAQLMARAEVSVIAWCFNRPAVKKICLNVFSNNWLPIGVHQSIGFKPKGIRKLTKVDDGQEVVLLIEGDRGEAQRFGLLRMELDRRDFSHSQSG